MITLFRLVLIILAYKKPNTWASKYLRVALFITVILPVLANDFPFGDPP